MRLYYQRLNDVLQVGTAEILVRIFEYEKVTEGIILFLRHLIMLKLTANQHPLSLRERARERASGPCG